MKAYLGRTTRLTYRREDLELVCEFLSQLPKDDELLRKLVGGGRSNLFKLDQNEPEKSARRPHRKGQPPQMPAGFQVCHA